MDHQPSPYGSAGLTHLAGWRAAGGNGLGGCVNYRRGDCGQQSHSGLRFHFNDKGIQPGGHRGRHCRCLDRRPAWHFPVSGVVARPVGSARERDDPGKSADAGAGPVRRRRILRQAHPGPARGLEPAVVAGEADLRSGSEPGVAAQLRCAAGAVLTLGRGGAADRRVAGFLRRDPVLR